MDFSNFLIDCLFKFEGVEGFKDFFELLFCFLRDVFGIENSLVRGFWFVVTFDGFGSDAFFGLEFDGRDEEVVVKPPFFFVKLI